jgi:voltage-gated potassium channel
MKEKLKALTFFSKKVLQQLHEQKVHTVATAAFFLLAIGGGLFSITEEMNFVDSLWWAVVTMTTVGYGDISPASTGGKLVGVVLMLTGIGIVGLFTATVASVFVENKILEHKGMRDVLTDNHIVLCGWNSQGTNILKELKADAKMEYSDIVILAEIEQSPVYEEQVHFVKGSLNHDTIKKANIENASTVILLSDDSVESGYRDAKTVMDILLLKKACPNLYICAELADSITVNHALQAGANEVVVVSDFRSKLLAQAALDHGITGMVSELVSNRYGNVFYKTPLPDSYVNREFFNIFCDMKKSRNVICLGIQRGSDDTVITNPKEDLLLEQGDMLLVVAESRDALA